jgi:hypothetical protein
MRSNLGRAAIVLGLVALAACGIFRAIMPSAGPAPRPFNHEGHTVRGIGCADCHETADKEVQAGMPSKDFCMTCHEELDKDPRKGLEKKVAWFLEPTGQPAWTAFTKQSSEVRFSHASHAAAKVGCAECHAGMDKDTGLVPGMLQRMSSCTECHAKRAPAKNDCATCHTATDRTTPPASHLQLWTRMHGTCSREGREASTSNECAMCHTKDSCTTCHQTRPPDDHTSFWRIKAHGIAAGIDRLRCATCHTSDSCARCHQATAPQSHTAGWNAPRDRHCTSCHQPLASNPGCAVCHRSTPGHDLAPPKPAWHSPVMICRSCHAATMKHPDNGDNCNACHR